MAKLVPEVAGRKLGSAAEKKLAERFRNELGDEHRLLHSVGLVRHEHKRWAEADFVLIGPAGVFVLEVKGGRVARNDGVWSFTDRHGHANEKYEGPFDQAGGAAGALQGWLMTAGHRRDDDSIFQVGYGVMTPDCVLDAVAPDIEPGLLFDQRDEGDLTAYVARISAYWEDRKEAGSLSPAEIDRLVAAVRPDFEATMTRSLRAGIVEDELVRFTEMQLDVVDGLSENQRVRVSGAAGTGKSLLAIREALRLEAAGDRVLVLCHTGALADWLRGSLADHENIEIKTLGSLLWELVKEGGLEDRVPDATADVLFDMFLPELAIEAIDAGDPAGFDALVVDEGQDLLRGDGLFVVDRLLKGGFTAGTWRFFDDPNQDIFGSPASETVGLLGAGSPVRFRLDRNCRNTREIVEMSTLLSGSRVNARSEVNGPEVEPPKDWNRPWEERAIEAAERALAEGTKESEVVVLTVSGDQRDELIARSRGLLSAERAPGRVVCSTVAGFKGLEATAVVLAGIWSLDEPHLRQASYVGSTRARVQLALAFPAEAEASWGRRVRDYAVEAAARASEADLS